jgi:outer membrane protein
MRVAKNLLAAAALLASLSAPAADLLEVWRAASQNDPDVALAQAQRASADARRDQAQALWRPGLELNGSAGRMTASSAMNGASFAAPGFGQSNGVAFATSVNNGNAKGWGVGLRQPLLSGELSARGEQLRQAAGVAELQAQLTRQGLILNTSQRYFDTVLAARRLSLLQHQQQAAQRALVEAQDRFKLGDAPVTDTHEARSRAQALQAQVLEADNALQMALATLRESSGLPTLTLPLALPAAHAAPPLPGALEELRQRALADNPSLGLLQAQVAVAEADVRSLSVSASATLDLVAQATRQHVSGSGDFGPAGNDSRQQLIGLQFRMPIDTGGRHARQQEALRAVDQARASLEQGRLQVGQQTRSAWLALDTAPARLDALAAALAAANARLEATRLGRSVGDRTTLDLLNAENERTGAALALLQGRIDALQQSLKLEALLGHLDEDSLARVNARLALNPDF